MIPQILGLLAFAVSGAGAYESGPSPAGSSVLTPVADTVHVAPPTGATATDRANILAALEGLEPGGTLLFASGTYWIGGAFIQVPVPDVILKGHPDGTILRGCEPADLVEHERMTECNGLELTGPRQTIRGFTFEQIGSALWVGCCLELAAPDHEGGQPHVGGHLIEGNTFRGTWNGIRVIGDSPEAAVIRDNDFVNSWHAVTVNGRTAHILGNRVSVPDPEQVPVNGHAGIAIAVTAFDTRGERSFTCAGNLIAGNRIEGHPEAIGILASRSGASCGENVIRDNIIAAARVRWTGPSWGVIGIREPTDSTLAGVPIALADLSVQMAEFMGLPAGDHDEDLIHENRIEGNRVTGAEGLAIQVVGASRNRIVGNTITGVRRREPFPGNTMIDDPEAWREANGSGIWVSPGSDGNEIAGNTFEDVAGAAVVLEGDSNRVELWSATDSVRDLGTGNRVGGRSGSADAAARSGHPVVIGQRHAVTSNILGEERPAFVHTPPDYVASSARYPVLYLLDAGQDTEAGRNFHVASALVRTRDLTPPETSTSVPSEEPTAGRPSFRWTWRVYPDQTHRSVLLESLGDGLEWTFDGWHPVQEFVRLAQREIDLGHQVERHFAELSARLGYAVAISERLLIDVGIAFFEARQSDLAIRAFESNRDLFPDSPVVHRFVAIGYEEACRRAEAAVSYDTARELAAAHGRPEEARRYGQLADRLRALIASGAPCA